MKIFAVALNTTIECVRNKVLYVLLFFSLGLFGLAAVLGNLTIGGRVKIIKDFGLASISIFGTLITIFIGINIIYKELEKKSVYTLLSKPITRHSYIFGKFLGLCFTLFAEICLMTFIMMILVHFFEGVFDWSLLKAVYAILLELIIITGVAIFFSSFSTPFLSGIFTLSIFVIGRGIEDMMVLARNVPDALLKGLMNVFYYMLPNLDNFDIKTQIQSYINEDIEVEESLRLKYR